MNFFKNNVLQILEGNALSCRAFPLPKQSTGLFGDSPIAERLRFVGLCPTLHQRRCLWTPAGSELLPAPRLHGFKQIIDKSVNYRSCTAVQYDRSCNGEYLCANSKNKTFRLRFHSG